MHPLAAERHHVDLWVRHLTTEPQTRTGRPAAPATVARKLSALSGFYDYGVHDAEVLTHSPVASVRRPKVSDESQAIGLTADELRRLLAAAVAHSSRSAALVYLLTFCGLRISEALGADVRDYGHEHGHQVPKVTRKGGKAARVALAPPVVRFIDAYLDGRTSGAIFRSGGSEDRWATRWPTSNWGGSAEMLACQLGSHRTACGTPTRLSHYDWVLLCRTYRTPLATPIQGLRGATTAVVTTSTGPPTTCWPAL